MIDGVKISCVGTSPDDWFESKLLPFALPVSVRTGEVLRKRIFVKHGELTFSVSPDYSGKRNFGRCQVRGSLHKFINKGSNNNAFTHSELCKSIEKLETDYFVNSTDAVLHGVEFGVNLRLENYTAYDVIKALVCLPTMEAENWKNKHSVVGKEFTRSQYALKIYDKGKQSGTGETDILRIELKVTRMQFLKKYGITHLSHLKDAEKVAPLGEMLLRIFDELIIYNGSIDTATLNQSQTEKLAQYLNPETWLHAPYRKRYKMKTEFKNLVSSHGNFDLKNYALFELKNKWFELLNIPQKSVEKFAPFQKKHVGATEDDFTFKIKGKIIPHSPNTFFLKEGNKKGNKKDGDLIPKKVKLLRTFCLICERDISKQRADSKTCTSTQYPERGRDCEKKYFVIQRQKKITDQREREENALTNLSKKIKGAAAKACQVWAVDLERKTENGLQAVALLWSQVSADTVGKIQRVVGVTVTPTKGEAVKVTKQRAKKLTRLIIETNQPKPTKKRKNKK